MKYKVMTEANGARAAQLYGNPMTVAETYDQETAREIARWMSGSHGGVYGVVPSAVPFSDNSAAEAFMNGEQMTFPYTLFAWQVAVGFIMGERGRIAGKIITENENRDYYITFAFQRLNKSTRPGMMDGTLTAWSGDQVEVTGYYMEDGKS